MRVVTSLAAAMLLHASTMGTTIDMTAAGDEKTIFATLLAAVALPCWTFQNVKANGHASEHIDLLPHPILPARMAKQNVNLATR